jgi:hypothetical protein
MPDRQAMQIAGELNDLMAAVKQRLPKPGICWTKEVIAAANQ